MNCCPHCQSADRYFNQRVAKSDLRKYRRSGPEGTTKQLLKAIKNEDVAGMSLLDIGGGSGVIQHELHAAGVTEVTAVDASSAYLQFARQEAERRGYVASHYIHGDFASMAEQVAPADIVTMDRVICCYPYMDALMSAAVEKARRFLALTYPRDVWWTRLGVRIVNLYPRLRKDPFRSYVHPTTAVERIATENEMKKVVHHDGPFWQTVIFAR
jgi:magnesium-protoporphyrin O-methyltransferase